jgi:signal transduction histidine kinase
MNAKPPFRLPRPWPKTLGAQLIAVAVMAVLLSNALVVAWFSFSNDRRDREAITQRLLERASATAVLISRLSPEVRAEAVGAVSGNLWGFYTLHRGKYVSPPMRPAEAQIAARLKAMLPDDWGGRLVAVHFSRTVTGLMPPRRRPPDADGRGPPPMRPHHSRDNMLFLGEAKPALEIVIPIDTDVQLVAIYMRPPPPLWSAQLIVAALLTILVTSLAAALLARRATRPLAKLAEAASLAARGGDAPRVPEEGPEDVRGAARAFNAMNDQVRRTLESQRHLLSAVGHDLRTPITAMRINIEFIDDSELAKRLIKNLDELQALTEAVLAAARGAGGEKLRPADLAALAESICADLEDLGEPVRWLGGDPVSVLCRPNEIRRALRNLIENAVKYAGKAEVSIIHNEQACEVHIEDEGPGIPAAERERVFEPFVRLEGSRNLETGGVGLGLTLAKAIVDGHGGKIVLEDRVQGGLRVRMILPRAAPKS